MQPLVCRGIEPCTDARTHPPGTIGIGCSNAGTWWLASLAAKARDGIHRRASRRGHFVGRARRACRSKSLSFCACLHAILRRASASLPHGPPDGSRQEPAAEASAHGDRDRRPGRLSRDEFIYEGISQVYGTYADRISTLPRGLTEESNGTPWRRKSLWRRSSVNRSISVRHEGPLPARLARFARRAPAYQSSRRWPRSPRHRQRSEARLASR